MRHAVFAILSAALLAITAPALAQGQPGGSPADANRIVFDLGAVSQDAAPAVARTTGFRTRQQEPPPACSSDSDIIQAQAAGPQRYDDNGAPIRAAPSCSLDRPRVSAAQTASRTDFLREPPCVESETGYTCASSDTTGRTRHARESQCEETATGRTCSSSGSISFGNSEEGRNLAEEELDRLMAD